MKLRKTREAMILQRRHTLDAIEKAAILDRFIEASIEIQELVQAEVAKRNEKTSK